MGLFSFKKRPEKQGLSREAMKCLRPFALAVSEDDDLILIRGMTHAELDGLFEGLPRQLF